MHSSLCYSERMVGEDGMARSCARESGGRVF